MVEVGGSNPPGPTKFSSFCFYSILFFQNRAFWRVSARAHWPDDPEYLESIEKSWEAPFGDMRQGLVFIGQNLDQERMAEALDACLLTEDQLLNGRQFWETLPDPFPAWQEAT
jgi:hypothetical protein